MIGRRSTFHAEATCALRLFYGDVERFRGRRRVL